MSAHIPREFREGDMFSDGCGPPEGKKQAFTPEFTRRLQALFPAGSDAAGIERAFNRWGSRLFHLVLSTIRMSVWPSLSKKGV